MLRRAGGGYELIRDKHGFILAGMESSRYRDYTLELRPGDELFVYTDGVPEATNAENELFGTERMVAALNRHADERVEALYRRCKRSWTPSSPVRRSSTTSRCWRCGTTDSINMYYGFGAALHAEGCTKNDFIIYC